MSINITIPQPDLSLVFGDFRSAYETINDVPGVYFLYDIKGSLLYVGKSVNLYSRINQHITGQGKSSAFSDLIYRIDILIVRDDLSRELYETYAINTLLPSYNISKYYNAPLSEDHQALTDELNDLMTERDFTRSEIYRLSHSLGDLIVYDVEDDMSDEEFTEFGELETLRREYRELNEKITEIRKKLPKR